MWKYETPEMEMMYFDEDIRTDVVGGSNKYIEPGDNNVEATYPF